MSAIFFLFWLLLLLVEGNALSSCILKAKKGSALTYALALPLASLVNVLIVFLYTVVHIPLFWWTILLGHIAVITGLSFYWKAKQATWAGEIEDTAISQYIRIPHILRWLCIVLLAGDLLFSFTHAIILPTYNIDSLTNWTMRSEVSFYDHAIAFDPTEVRGVAKPQYPFLFHALQITANEGNSSWNDRAANVILFLLTLSSFWAIFVMMKMQKGFDVALLTITSLLSIPLLAFHLAEGYADIHLTTFLLLSFVTFFPYSHNRDARWLVLSSLFVAAAAWTKIEGLVIGTMPWIGLVVFDIWKNKKSIVKQSFLIALAPILLSFPFYFLLLEKGLQLTPHTSDTSIGWHGAAFVTVLSGLFTGGSMGLTWYALILAIPLIVFRNKKSVPMLLWGIFALLVVIGAYVLTPNAAFLENGESYYRQLMPPAALLILWCFLMWNAISVKSLHQPQ
jgi:hypothetical protein